MKLIEYIKFSMDNITILTLATWAKISLRTDLLVSHKKSEPEQTLLSWNDVTRIWNPFAVTELSVMNFRVTFRPPEM